MRNKTRKTRTLATLATAALVAFTPLKAEAQKDNPNLSVSSDIANQSRFWGMPFLDTPHYKQSINLDYKNLSTSIVAHADVNQGRFFDVDLLVSYSHPLSSIFSVYGGGLGFAYHNEEKIEPGAIAYAGVEAEVPLNPSVTYSKLFGFGGGDYIESAVSEDIPKTGINLTGKLGWNHNALWEGTGFTHAEGIATTTIDLSDNIQFSPRLNYISPFIEDVPRGFLVGANLSFTF
ncbi:MAG TPA: hypothetical protein ENH99_02600 [Candidatus Pacearchaeota archaeon]|nr:hypothetical protein [Candidatus Pacearchaeota archaeon]